MKPITAASILALSSIILGVNAFPKQGAPSVSGGTVVDTTYNFKNDRFGTNDNLRLGAVVTQQGPPRTKSPKRGMVERDSEWGLYIRDADAEYLYERNAYPYPKKSSSSVSGGNSVQNTYELKGDNFGNNNNLNMQSTTGVYGGTTVAAVTASTGKKGKGKRDAYAEIESLLSKREALHGGAAKGGSSKTKGGNTSSTKSTLNGDKSRGNGRNIDFQSTTYQVGGTTIGSPGGANYANGGAGGAPPSPNAAKRWLQARDVEISARSAELESLIFERKAFLNGGAAKGGDSKTNGGNNSKNNNNAKGSKGNVYMPNYTVQNGGNTKGGNGGANAGNGGAGGSFSIPLSIPIPVRRWLEERDAEPEFQESFHLYAREAYPEAEAEAEAEAYPEAEADLEDGLYARDAYPEAYAEAEAEAYAEAYPEPEADPEAEAAFDFGDGLYSRETSEDYDF